MGKLSRDQAVSLLDELHEVVEKIRILEAKYDLEHQSKTPVGLGVNLLVALRPYGQDPEVRGKALQAGLELPPVDSLLAPAISMQEPEDDIAELSTAWGSRQSTESSQQSVPLASEDLAVLPATQPATPPATPPATLRVLPPDVGRKLLVVPALSCTPGQRTLTIKHRRDASVKELRKQLAACLQMPLGKMRILAEVDGEAVIMGDHECAEHASILFVRSTAAPIQSAGIVNMGKVCTLEQCLQMHQDVLHSLASAGQPLSTQRLTQVQTSIFHRYGFASSASGAAAMLHALDCYVCNAEIRRRVDQINQMMDYLPQVYNLQVKDGRA